MGNRLLVFRLELEIVLRAALEVLTAPGALRGRGVKNLLNLLGVIGGGLRILPFWTFSMAELWSSSSTFTPAFLDLVLLVGVWSIVE